MTHPDEHRNPTTDDAAPIVHLYVLLDRSGSMASIADDVIGGFNQLLAEQQADGADALITLVQFDSQDPHEVIADATAGGFAAAGTSTRMTSSRATSLPRRIATRGERLTRPADPVPGCPTVTLPGMHLATSRSPGHARLLAATHGSI